MVSRRIHGIGSTPLGPVDATVTAAVARGITAAYGFRARVLPGQPLPRAAFYRPRKRYNSCARSTDRHRHLA